jgi:hypothetical protein
MSQSVPTPRGLHFSPMFAVLLLGVVVRALLIPLTHGQDFVVWDKASAATLHGVNIYAHHPVYPAGPYAYFPLWLYIELPFQWLAQHSGIPFQVAGKLPIAAADLACALLIAAAVRAQGRSKWAVAGAAGAFFLNPLVLYNSAYYGRFDSLGCALLLAALLGLSRHHRAQWRTAGYYALAVAAKTFPVLVVVGVLRSAKAARYRIVILCAAVIVVLTLPYLGAPRALYTDIFRYDATKVPQGLSWQRELLGALGVDQAKQLSYLLLICFAVVAVLLALTTDLWLATALTLVAFLLFSKVVLEQYLIWPLPFLLVVAAGAGAALAGTCLVLAGLLTTIGMLDNATYHPLEPSAVVPYSLAAICLIGLVVCATMRRASPSPSEAVS